MNTAWSTGYKSFDTITGTLSATFAAAADPAATTIIGTLKFGNKDAAAFHKFKAFCSAVITDDELAQAIKESISTSLATGTSFEEWRKTADQLFDQQGVTRLNSFKAETIYRNETAMAYGAGQFAKLQTVSGAFPYWQYTTAHDERVRESHRLLDGKIFRASDSEYYPPLGFNCRCRAIPVSLRQVETQDIKGPDTITPEMRANLQNAEFIGDKIGNFTDWLNQKMGELSPQSVTLITEKLTEIETQLAELAAETDKLAADQAALDALNIVPSVLKLRKQQSIDSPTATPPNQ